MRGRAAQQQRQRAEAAKKATPSTPKAAPQTKSQAQRVMDNSTRDLLSRGFTLTQIQQNKIPKADQKARAMMVNNINNAIPDPRRSSSSRPASTPAPAPAPAPAPPPPPPPPPPQAGGSMVGRRSSRRFTASAYDQGREIYETGAGNQPATVTSGRAQADSEGQVAARARDLAEELRRNREKIRLARLGG